MTLTVTECLDLGIFSPAQVVAGHSGLNRSIRWAHVVDIPNILNCILGGELILTTGYAWSQKAEEMVPILSLLNERGIAGLVFETVFFLHQLPLAFLTEADRLGMPILQSDKMLSFVSITEAIHKEIMRRQYENLTRSEQIHRVLTESAVHAEDLNDIVESLGQVTQRSVWVENGEGRVLAAYSPEDCPYKSPLKAPELISRQVRADGTAVATLSLFGGTAPLGELDKLAAEHATTVIAFHYLYRESLNQMESRLHQTFFDGLLWGGADAQRDLLARASHFGLDLRHEYAIALLVMIGPEGERKWPIERTDDLRAHEQLATHAQKYLERQRLPRMCTYSLNRVVLLVSRRDQGDQRTLLRDLEAHLLKKAGQTPFFIAVSQFRTGIADLREALREAETASMAAPSFTGIHYFEDLQYTILLDGIADRERIGAYVARTLGPLLRPESKELYATLLGLITCSFSQLATAKRMHIHRNTLRYRIHQIEELLHCSLGDAEDQFRLRLAVESAKVVHMKHG